MISRRTTRYLFCCSLLTPTENRATFARRRVGEYLDAVIATAGRTETIGEPSEFIEILNDTASQLTFSEIDKIVILAPSAGDIERLPAVSTLAWASLIEHSRVPTTFANIVSYLEHTGEIDISLGVLLERSGAITECEDVPQAERLELAKKLLSARDVISTAESRVLLVEPLGLLDELAPTDVEAESGPLVGLLLGAKQLLDNEDAFTTRLMVDWATKEFAMSTSANLPRFISSSILNRLELHAFFTTPAIADGPKQTVSEQVKLYLSPANEEGLTAAAVFARDHEINYDLNQIDQLIDGGVIPDLIVSLAVVSNDIDLDATWQLLRKFGGDYEAIADPGFRRPHVSDIPANWLLLQQLQSAGVVAKFGADNERRDIWVTLRQS